MLTLAGYLISPTYLFGELLNTLIKWPRFFFSVDLYKIIKKCFTARSSHDHVINEWKELNWKGKKKMFVLFSKDWFYFKTTPLLWHLPKMRQGQQVKAHNSTTNSRQMRTTWIANWRASSTQHKKKNNNNNNSHNNSNKNNENYS